MTRPMIWIRNLNRHWTPWRRNTLTSRPSWQMSQASTRQEMYYTQRPWKWLKSSNEPRKIMAVYRTIWIARAMHWPRQPKNFRTPTCSSWSNLRRCKEGAASNIRNLAQGHGDTRRRGDTQGANSMYYKLARQGRRSRLRGHWLFGSGRGSRSQTHALPDMRRAGSWEERDQISEGGDGAHWVDSQWVGLPPNTVKFFCCIFVCCSHVPVRLPWAGVWARVRVFFKWRNVRN